MGAAAAGGAAGGLFSMVGGIVSASMQSKAQKKIAREQMRQQLAIHEASGKEREKSSQMVRADQDIARQNLMAGEQARLSLLTSLGQPGTYGPGPGSRGGPLSLGVLTPTGLSGLRRDPSGAIFAGGTQRKTGIVMPGDVSVWSRATSKSERPWEVEGAFLDPEAMAGAARETAGFRTVSRMVAEAEQLMNRSGPLWDQLNNSVVGGVYESNAAFQRQAMEQVSRAMARGGTARRAGLQMAQAFQVQEQINRNRTGQLWQSKLALEEYRTKYAQQVTSYSQAWVNNHAGIRDSFVNALQNLQLYWSSTMAPTLAGATVGAQSATQQGVLAASQGLMDATKVRGQAISGAVEGLTGMIQENWGAISGMFTGGATSVAAGGAVGSGAVISGAGAGAAAAR